MNHDSLKTLRTILENALADKLGTYTFPNGLKEKAIAVDIGGKYPPSDTKIEGLEVVITPYTDIESNGLNNGYADLEFAHEINLKQWNPKPSLDLMECVARVRSLLGNSVEIGPRLIPLDELGNIESCKIIYLERRFIHG